MQKRPHLSLIPWWERGMLWHLGTPRAQNPWSASQLLQLPHSTGSLLWEGFLVRCKCPHLPQALLGLPTASGIAV